MATIIGTYHVWGWAMANVDHTDGCLIGQKINTIIAWAAVRHLSRIKFTWLNILKVTKVSNAFFFLRKNWDTFGSSFFFLV
jgi:hypothetical protein